MYPYYDYAHGYGIPQAGYFLDEKEKAAPTFLVSEKDDSIEVEVSDTAFSDSQNADSMKLLYYHIADSTGFLTKYAVVKVKNKKALVLDRNDIPENGSLQVHYEGYTEERKLQ